VPLSSDMDAWGQRPHWSAVNLGCNIYTLSRRRGGASGDAPLPWGAGSSAVPQQEVAWPQVPCLVYGDMHQGMAAGQHVMHVQHLIICRSVPQG